MIRKIITIDEDKCNGCGLCVNACHEGAIGLIDGKAKLLRDDYCDGLGNCLPVCPTDAISFVEREAAEFDEEAVKQNMAQKQQTMHPAGAHGGCPGSHAKMIERKAAPVTEVADSASQLNQWPVQIKLVPVNAPYFNNAKLLIAADCTAYAYAGFHQQFMRDKITIIGCPKLDEGDYSDKLTAILKQNNIKSLTVVRMEVPCCGGISNAAITALQNSGKMIPWQIVTISTDGQIIDN
ncbi:4Fe-4S binding protein [Oscillospiraceae bacterium PP1C4]